MAVTRILHGTMFVIAPLDPDPPVVELLALVLTAVTLAKKLFHAAIVAEGYVYVDSMLPDPTQIPSWPGIASTASAVLSPPTTETVPLTFETSPVRLLPRMNSRRSVNACGKRKRHVGIGYQTEWD